MATDPAAFDPKETFIYQSQSSLSRSETHVVQRAYRTARSYLQHMGVDHGGRHITVAQKLLHRADIGARLQQMCGAGCAQKLACKCPIGLRLS